MDNYPKSTVPLIALVPVFIIASLFLEGAWRIVAVVALLVLVGALSATVGAQVKKQRDARGLN
jgi:hypothetical protein